MTITAEEEKDDEETTEIRDRSLEIIVSKGNYPLDSHKNHLISGLWIIIICPDQWTLMDIKVKQNWE